MISLRQPERNFVTTMTISDTDRRSYDQPKRARQPSLPAAHVRSAPYLGTMGNLRHTPRSALASRMLRYIVVRLITHVPFVPLCFCSPCSLVIILL